MFGEVKYENKNTRYEMKMDKVNKLFYASASGFFTEEDGKLFTKDYDKITKTFNTKDYSLVIDASNDLKPSSPKVAELLVVQLDRYMSVPFKKRFLITKGNVITISQFKRLGKNVKGWAESVEYVNDINEVKQKLK